MFNTHAFPILEFDTNRHALIEPADLAMHMKPLPDDRLVITFFPEVIARLLSEGELEEERVIGGENPFPVYRFKESGVLLILGQVGCPACAGNLDMLQGLGAKRVMFCGGGGVLDRDIGVGQLMLTEGAIRDEGFSYHYLPASRVVEADKEVNDAIAAELTRRNIPFLRGLAWTTDAIARETPDRIAARRAEGAKIVEMEQAGCLAVAQFRGFRYAALLYGGDDVSGESWDDRQWNSREGIRYSLVRLCAELTEAL